MMNAQRYTWLMWAMAVWLSLAPCGCSRVFWRDQANRDSYGAIRENLSDPRWDVPRIDLTPDPRSRFYSPYSPDYAPLPPDDPYANVYMHWVDGWQGYKCWHEFGVLMSVENPQWLAQFDLAPEYIDPDTGAYLPPLPEIDDLTLCQALELALINNREYQFELEDVFLRALEVTAERYQFSVRYIGAGGQTPGADGSVSFSPDGGTDVASVRSSFGVSQFLPTGGLWVVELVNNTIWLFDGPNQTQTASTLAFALTQPLLFQAGRKVVLERLTQSERNLLYAVRDLARFRRVFFTSVVGGGSGYLSLLGQLQRIRNTESNIFRLEEQVEILKATSSQPSPATREELLVLPPELATMPEFLEDKLVYDADRSQIIWVGPMTDAQAEQLRGLSPDADYQRAINEIIQTLTGETATLDVLQVQSQLADTISQLRQQEQFLQDSLDAFKILLGLPTDFVITLDDQLLEQFQFIDERLFNLEQEVKEFAPYWGQINAEEPDPAQVKEVALRLRELLQESQSIGLESVRADFDRVEEIYEDRLEGMESDVDRERLIYDLGRDRRLYDDVAYNIGQLLNQTEVVLQQLDDPDVEIDRVKVWVSDIKGFQEQLVPYIGTLQAVQIGLRVELVLTQPFDLPLEEAVAIGMENRLDLKNAKAQVMDARRRVEVAANALQSNLDVVVEGELNTPGPVGNTDVFEFRGDLSDIRVGMAFDSPLDLNQERNIYRAALIDYQRAKRDYMRFEDEVKQAIRADWRQLQVQRRNLETARQSIRIAAAQFDSTVAEAYAPPGIIGVASPRTAGLRGQNIQNALRAVLNAQNSMIDTWVNFERFRLNIYRDMGIMDVGPDNVWNDPFYRDMCGGAAACFPDGQRGSDERAIPYYGREDGGPEDGGPDDGPDYRPSTGGDVPSSTNAAGDVGLQRVDRAVGRGGDPRGRDRGGDGGQANLLDTIQQVGWKRFLPFGDRRRAQGPPAGHGQYPGQPR